MKKQILLLFLLISLCLTACSQRQNMPSDINETDYSLNNTAISQTSAPPKKDTSVNHSQLPATGSNLSYAEPLSEEAASSLVSLQTLIADKKACCGIAFLGKNKDAKSIAECIEDFGLLSEKNYDNSYPFMPEITAACCANKAFDCYFCLVPQMTVSSVVIREKGKSGEKSLLYSSNECSPVFFAANCDGKEKSNIIITVANSDGTTIEYSPVMDSEGKLQVNQDVYDFSLP